MPRLGITGSFGSGKTTVARFFQKLGAKVVDADKITHALIAPQGACFKGIVKAFGRSILTSGRIDRKKLAEVVFRSPLKRRKLERIIHPRVIARIKNEIRKNKGKLVVVEIPLLFEKDLQKMFDVVAVVDVNQTNQINRLKKRAALTTGEILERIRAQWPIKRKIKLADCVIDNTGSLQKTKKQVLELYKILTRNQERKK